MNDRLALNLGIRYDHTAGDVPDTEQLNAHLGPTGKTFTGIPDLIKWNDVSPRFGATVKLDATGKTVAKVSWGRYYGKLIAPMFNNISPGNTQINALYYNGATGKFDIPGGVFFNPKANYGIDPNLQNQWTNQLYIGMERQLQPDFGGVIVKCCGSPRELGGAFLRLRDDGVRCPLHAVDKEDAGAHERQQFRAIHFSPALFRHREQLERHHQRLRP